MNSRLVLPLLLFGIAFFSSCKKQSDNVFLTNEGTLGFDGYSFADSFKLITSTVREDSIKTDSLSHNLLGAINDEVFGTSQASSFIQFKLPQLNKVISSETLDSVVLFIQFTSPTAYYGDLNTFVSFNVYELNQPMNGNTTHSDQTYTFNNTPVGSFSGKFRPSDSLRIIELGKPVKVSPGISIKLSNSMASKLFNATLNDLSSQDNFIQFFKGFALVPNFLPSPGSGAIAAINMLGTFSKIRIYYNDSLQSDFKVIDGARRFTHYTIGQQSNVISKQKSLGGNFDTTYIQSMTGAKTRITIPYLFGIAKNNAKKISVGKAEVIIRPLAGTYSNPFTLPTRLLLLQPNPENNLNAGIIDLLEPFYGGKYNSISNEYRFNITRYIQDLYTNYQLKGINKNFGLFLITPSDYPIAPTRIVLDTRKGIVNAGIEFKLIYTEL